ncbi:MAG: hypothetical protein WCT52_02165 [Candidatus Micrarchaeia archaeon]
MADLVFCSHYPFSRQAKEYVSGKGLELTSSILDKAEARVKEAVLDGKIRRVAELPDTMEEELALYAASRMIISSANNRYLINRYAVAEAKRAREYLNSDDASRPAFIDEVASEFGVKFEKSGEWYALPLSGYLAYTPRSIDYKLSNREVSGGKVRVKKMERLRILEEAVKKRTESSLPIRAEFQPEVKAAGARILSILPKLETALIRVGQEGYPPCITKMIEELALNINVPHTGRVALAIYLVNVGLTTDKIVEFFRHAPDFNEKTTRYQVEHIRARKYNMPSCSTMDSYGACVAECHCGTPLNFRQEIHGRRLKRMEEENKGSEKP